MSRLLQAEPAETLDARRFMLSGRVQGLGVRPAIARLAAGLDLCGIVSNRLEGVEVVVEGPAERLNRFREQLLGALPESAFVAELVDDTVVAGRHADFRIEEQLEHGAVAAEVPRDIAVCERCLEDVASRSNRRYGYVLTSCTGCGPRYSIIERMPFERSLSGMAAFSFCSACRQEYENPGDRRFHAQTTCCANCGPQVWCVDASGSRRVSGRSAIDLAASAIGQGEIVALRGIGGYQLLCDATDESAVRRLRDRKRRPAKPLAVMVESVAVAEEIAVLEHEEREALTSSANPIVLVTSRPNSPIARSVHPGLGEIGLMLPATPLHWLLAQAARRPLIVTSGNREGAPLAVNVEAAERELTGIADLWLHHDRPIRRPIDDSVVRIIANRPVTIRCARGLAPLPLPLETSLPLLAVGGQQKSAVAISNARQCVLGPHVGDLGGVDMQTRFGEHVDDFHKLYGEKPAGIVHDLHPTYFSTQWAREQSIPTRAVQHHHAHIVAGMLEHGWLDREVIGVAFDGTGFGTDGTIWGGEFLLATAGNFRRVARLRPFSLPGGEAAIREPWRIAVALVAEAAGAEAAAQLGWPNHNANDVRAMLAIWNNRRFSPMTTSAGRLFDAIAALVLQIDHADYEGEAAMRLESACDRSAIGQYEIPVQESEFLELDWRPLVRQLIAERLNTPPDTMATRFHRGLAAGAVAVVGRFSPRPVVLAGGTFQNRVLTEFMVEELCRSNQPLGLPGCIPPNDGGLAAGQLAIAVAMKQFGSR